MDIETRTQREGALLAMADENKKVEPIMLAINTVATMLDTSPHTIRNLVAAGDLKGVRLGEILRVTRDSLADFIERGGSGPQYRERLASGMASQAQFETSEKPKHRRGRKKKAEAETSADKKTDTSAKAAPSAEAHIEADTLEQSPADQAKPQLDEPKVIERHYGEITSDKMLDYTDLDENGQPKEIQ